MLSLQLHFHILYSHFPCVLLATSLYHCNCNCNCSLHLILILMHCFHLSCFLLVERSCYCRCLLCLLYLLVSLLYMGMGDLHLLLFLTNPRSTTYQVFRKSMNMVHPAWNNLFSELLLFLTIFPLLHWH